ncbi:MAG: hypothetical protein DDT26_01208 [Dehalococcoidia bacterium]|nr:hypothetical protein [Chloroflexota bacterium]
MAKIGNSRLKMKYFGIVYKATNKITEQIYIGVTRLSLHDRIARHIRTSRSRKGWYFHNAICLYGIEAFDWVILRHCMSKEELIQGECFYIAQYQSYLPNKGYNLTHGGDGCSATEETRNKISIALLGHKHSEETKRKIGMGMLATKRKNGTLSLSEQAKAKISSALKGKSRKPIPEKVRQKISLSMKGNNNFGNFGSPRKPILKLDNQANVLQRFSSIAEAAEKCQLDRGSISNVCSGKRRTCGNFSWRLE